MKNLRLALEKSVVLFSQSVHYLLLQSLENETSLPSAGSSTQLSGAIQAAASNRLLLGCGTQLPEARLCGAAERVQ